MAAYEIPNLRFSAEAGEAIPRRRFVAINDQEQGIVCDGAVTTAIGVSTQPTEAAGEVLEIADGIVMVEAAGAITAGDNVGADSEGRGFKFELGTSAGMPFGTALTNAAAAGELVTIKFR
jgi:hypothetical protein